MNQSRWGNHTWIIMILISVMGLLLARSGGAFSTSDPAYIPSKWGFVDRQGKVAIEPTYTRVEAFSEGRAAVKTGGTHFLSGKWGYIDRDGNTVITSQYDGARSFHEGRAAVSTDGKWGVIDETGAWRLKPAYEFIGDSHSGLAPFKQDGKWGYLDRQGAVAIAPRFEDVWGFSEGLAAVAPGRNEKGVPGPWGFIDNTGRMAIDPQFGSGGLFSAGFAAVKGDGRIGYIDREGRWAISPRFFPSWKQQFHDSVAVVCLSEKGEKMALIDRTGTIIRDLGYAFDHGVRYEPEKQQLLGGHSDYEEHHGDPVWTAFDPEHARIQEGLVKVFQCDAGVAVQGKALYGFAEPTGRIVIAPRFEHVEAFSEGRAAFAVDINWEAAGNADRAVDDSGHTDIPF
jgi:hypothetical protein